MGAETIEIERMSVAFEAAPCRGQVSFPDCSCSAWGILIWYSFNKTAFDLFFTLSLSSLSSSLTHPLLLRQCLFIFFCSFFSCLLPPSFFPCVWKNRFSLMNVPHEDVCVCVSVGVSMLFVCVCVCLFCLRSIISSRWLWIYASFLK